MNSLKACIKKEFFEGIKTHKFLIVAIGILIFAVADPAFLKLTPEILKSQFGSSDPNFLAQFQLDLSQKGGILKYAGDLFQLGTLVTALTLAGLISSERSSKTLTIPLSMGCKVSAVVFSKLVVYGLYSIILTTAGMLTAYYYGWVIFGQSKEISLIFALKSGLLYGLFFVAMLSILLLFSSILKKGFLAGIVTLLLTYLSAAIGPLFKIEKYLPSHLTNIATSINGVSNSELITTLSCTVLIVIVTSILSIAWLKKVELV